MNLGLIELKTLEHLNEALKSIQASPNLESQDVPVLKAHLAAIQSVAENRVSAPSVPGQSQQVSKGNIQPDEYLTVQEAADLNRVTDVNEKRKRVVVTSREAVSSNLADMTKAGKNLLTEKKAAEYLRVHAISLKRWRLAGKGPKYVPFGPRQVRYEVLDLDHFIDQLKKGGLDAKTA